MQTQPDTQALKQRAGEFAAGLVESGMVLGLGTGSTAIFATRRISARIQSGELQNIAAIPTSLATQAAAETLGIPLTTFAAHPHIDMTIDGADEIDPAFNLIKGGGGALLREKIVAQTTQRLVIVADESKRSAQLGTRWAVPIEVIPFGWHSQAAFLQALGAQIRLRRQADGTPYATDQRNLILDCDFGKIANARALAQTLNQRAGIVEHGLFIGLAQDLIIAGTAGLQHLSKNQT